MSRPSSSRGWLRPRACCRPTARRCTSGSTEPLPSWSPATTRTRSLCLCALPQAPPHRLSALVRAPGLAVTGTTGPRLRHALDGIPTYKPGRPAAARAGRRRTSCPSNENPYPPLPSVLDVVRRRGGVVQPLPRHVRAGLVAAHRRPVRRARRRTWPPAPGRSACCSSWCRPPRGEGDEVVYAWRSFEAYPIVVQISGATVGDGAADAPASTTTSTRWPPRSPTRTRLVLRLLAEQPDRDGDRARASSSDSSTRCRATSLVVIDEAYREFVRDPDVPDALDVYRDRPNVAVLRTFSKAYGLAGLRVGFARRARAGRRRAAQDRGPVRRQRRRPGARPSPRCTPRTSCSSGSSRWSRSAPACRTRCASRAGTSRRREANFVWLRLGSRTEEFAAACEAAGVVVRPFAGEGARVTVAESEANDLVLQVSERFAPSH